MFLDFLSETHLFRASTHQSTYIAKVLIINLECRLTPSWYQFQVSKKIKAIRVCHLWKTRTKIRKKRMNKVRKKRM
ncbi:MAG: hypothetical protein ACXAEU_25305, partial [Candidatus Hodarchaeales archaeon]